MEKLERITKFSPAFDRRDPDPNKNYGIHGVDLRMIVKGEHGAVQFVLYTEWMLPHVQDEMDCRNPPYRPRPVPADLGYHAHKPQYDGQEPSQRSCQYLDGAPCYYDGSGLQAIEVFKMLLSGGSDAVWKFLEERYHSMFDGE